MSREARARFLEFAGSREATWPANFRDFSAAVLRMSTLAKGGRIDTATVEEELERLRAAWSQRSKASPERDELSELFDDAAQAALDRFDRVQLTEVVRVCRASPTLSAAGRTLFDRSRLSKAQPNDADRLRKYLARYGLEFADLGR